MEKKLASLFEYQRFAQNPRLSKLIAETENKYANEIADDDLWMVNAAGAPELSMQKEKELFLNGKENG